MLVFLLFLVFVGGLVTGGGRTLELKNSKGETFSYKDRLLQETEVFDIRDRFDQKLYSSADQIITNRSTLRKPWPFGPVPPCSAKVEAKGSHDNFIAARIPGEWTFHQPTTDFLKANEDNETEMSQDDVTLSFTDDPSILAEVTEDKCVFIAKTGRRVFAAGTFGIHSKEHGNHLFPYVLIDHDGTSVIVYWPSTGPTAIPMLVQMAPGVNTEHDLLIIGEDQAGKPFGLLHRTTVSMPGTESSEKMEETVSTLDDKESTDGPPEAEFNLASFLAEQGASLVETKLDEYVAVVGGDQAESDKVDGTKMLADGLPLVGPEAEPEPMANVLVETNQAEEENTFGKDLTMVVDPVVKMLVEVEENDDDIEKDQTVE